MNKKSKQFLYDLLSTPSPSGNEWGVQRKWLDFVKTFADHVDTDLAGNAYAAINPDAPFKVALVGHCDEIGFMIRRIDDEGFLYIEEVGSISPKIAPGMRMQILGTHETITGVVGVRAEHHGGLEDEIECSELYIDCGATDREEIEEYVEIGDLAVYQREITTLLNNRLSARGLDNRTGAFVIAEVLRQLARQRKRLHPDVAFYAISTVGEELDAHGAYFAGSRLQPDLCIICDVTFATDHPEVDEDEFGEFGLDEGPVLAKGSPINDQINALLEAAAEKEDIDLQYELTPQSTYTDGDRIRFTGQGVPFALVSLPIRYMHAPVETMSLDDLEDELKLLCTMLKALTGKEELRPILP